VLRASSVELRAIPKALVPVLVGIALPLASAWATVAQFCGRPDDV
jgi:hypothetical protein